MNYKVHVVLNDSDTIVNLESGNLYVQSYLISLNQWYEINNQSLCLLCISTSKQVLLSFKYNRTCQIDDFFGAGMMTRSPPLQNYNQIGCKSTESQLKQFNKFFLKYLNVHASFFTINHPDNNIWSTSLLVEIHNLCCMPKLKVSNAKMLVL